MYFSLPAQQVKTNVVVGIKAGLTITEATCIRSNGFEKRGVATGVFTRLKLDKKWTSQLELLFTQKGSKNKGNPKEGFDDRYYMSLYYLECPVFFQYHFKRLFLEFGPGFGYMIRSREFYDEGN